MKSIAEPRCSVGLPALILVALFIPPLLSESTIVFLIATPLREAVAAVLVALVLLGVCYLAVPRVTVHSSAATDRGDD